MRAENLQVQDNNESKILQDSPYDKLGTAHHHFPALNFPDSYKDCYLPSEGVHNHACHEQRMYDIKYNAQ